MNERFEMIDNRFEMIDQRLARIDQRLDRHEKMFELYSSDLKSVKVDVEYLSERIGLHDMQINNLNKRYQSQPIQFIKE